MQDQLDRDIKAAMLSGDKNKAEVLRGLKSALQYESVSLNIHDRILNDDQVLKVMAREAKKRQDAAELYKNAGEQQRADTELAEKEIISGYLPAQLSEEEINHAVEEEFAKLDAPTPADMGRIIGAVRGKLGPAADGAIIARLVKEKLK